MRISTTGRQDRTAPDVTQPVAVFTTPAASAISAAALRPSRMNRSVLLGMLATQKHLFHRRPTFLAKHASCKPEPLWSIPGFQLNHSASTRERKCAVFFLHYRKHNGCPCIKYLLTSVQAAHTSWNSVLNCGHFAL